ncbi:MAG: 4-amino-4-deoxychorismate lyase [Verrucomicrobia bacterium]|nr:4-amino-4-deoxychorismate lyase [Verrucomicrobiota bacterium]
MQFTEKEAKANPSNEGSESVEPWVWRNGKVIRAGEAHISPFDHGILVGDGVFETLNVYDGEPFAASRHFCRLEKSAGKLGLKVPDESELLAVMREVLEANELSKARIRVTITGGISPLGSDRGTAEHTMLVAASPIPEYAETGKVITVPFTRNENSALVGVKSTSYGENVVALALAKKQGAVEAIFANNAGMLCEGTGCNIFVVLDGKLLTPTLASGCLAGVTRSVVLDVCEELGIEVREKDMPLNDLKKADEAFLSSSLREVQGIERVDEVDLPVAPGPITQKIRQAFKAFVSRNPDPSADGFRFE